MDLEIIRKTSGGTSDPRRTVLVVTDNSQIALWVVRSLGQAGLRVFGLCCSRTELARYSRYLHGAWLMDIGASDGRYAQVVAKYAERAGAGSVMTIAEASHDRLTAYWEIGGCSSPRLLSPSRKSLERATDKEGLRQLCKQLSIPVAEGTTLTALMARDDHPGLNFPVVLRTKNQLAGSERFPWKVAYARNADELKQFRRDFAAIASNILVQEYHPGAEEHVHVLMHDGEPFMLCAYIGEHHMPLAGGVTVRRVSCAHAGPAADAVKLLKTLDWNGVATVQFHYDPATGKYVFIEINPRFCAGMGTVIRAGFDSPYLLWQSYFEPDRMIPATVKTGVRTRMLGADLQWMISMMKGDPLPPDQVRLSKIRSAVEFLDGFGPGVRDDIFSFGDPLPYLADLAHMVTKRIGMS